MFPLWPVKMRIGVWYLSVGVLGLIAAFFGLAIVRLIGWVITKLTVSPGIWLFPNLFADVGFVCFFSLPLLTLSRDEGADEEVRKLVLGRFFHSFMVLGLTTKEI